MKRILFIAVLMVFQWSSAQITSRVVNKANFEQSGFPFKGVRVLTVEHISTPTEENIYVFSKNERSAPQDELYIQQFKKIDGKWQPTTEKTIAKTGIITSVWDARKAFFDADKDGQADVLFVYSEHAKENSKRMLSVSLLLIYKNKIYTTTYSKNDEKTTSDFSPSDLPPAVYEAMQTYWERLDKA